MNQNRTANHTEEEFIQFDNNFIAFEIIKRINSDKKKGVINDYK